ncbi:TetR/AcrR family transcriptional regulator [Actinoplanes sp. CA-131856]
MPSAEPPAPVAAPAPTLRRDAERNRQRILDAAREVFAAQGLTAGLNEIARHAGLGVGTVYRRFPDKEALIEAVLQDEVDAIVEVATNYCRAENAWDGLTGLLHTLAERQVANRGLQEAMLSSSQDRNLTTAFRARLGPRVAELVDRAQRDGLLRPGVSLGDLLMIMHMVCALGRASEAVSPGAYQQYLALFLDSLRTAPSGSLPAPGITESQAESITGRLAPSEPRALDRS